MMKRGSILLRHHAFVGERQQNMPFSMQPLSFTMVVMNHLWTELETAPDGDEYSPAHHGVSSTEITPHSCGGHQSRAVGWRKAKSPVPFLLAALADPDIYQRTVELSFGTLVHIFRSWMFVCRSWLAPVLVMMMMLTIVVNMEKKISRRVDRFSDIKSW